MTGIFIPVLPSVLEITSFFCRYVAADTTDGESATIPAAPAIPVLINPLLLKLFI